MLRSMWYLILLRFPDYKMLESGGIDLDGLYISSLVFNYTYLVMLGLMALIGSVMLAPTKSDEREKSTEIKQVADTEMTVCK